MNTCSFTCTFLPQKGLWQFILDNINKKANTLCKTKYILWICILTLIPNFMDGGKVVISWFISQWHKLSRTNVYQPLSHVSLGFMYFNVFHTNEKVSTLIKYATLTCLSKIIFIDKRVQKYFKLIILLKKKTSPIV